VKSKDLDPQPDRTPSASGASNPLNLLQSMYIRNPALTILTILAVIFTLQLAQTLLIPLVLGVLISYTLDPVVTWFAKKNIPRTISAALLLITIAVGVVGLIYILWDDGLAIVDQLPTAAQKLRERLRDDASRGPGAIKQVQKAATEIERAAAEAMGSRPPPKPVEPLLDLRRYLWWGSLNIVAAAGQIILLLFLTYFILVSGDLFKRKLVKIAGSAVKTKRLTVEILDDINRQIERFLYVQLFTSLVAALLTWLVLTAVGLNHAGVWGIAAGVGNFIPYIGPIIIASLITIAAFLQFETFSMAALIAMMSLAVKGFVGFILTPWVMSKAAKMNTVAVFVGLLFWGWVWGVWGMLLAIPIIVVIKVICDRIEGLKSIGELLGD
jgi:predicted PurR-regulated permease PerM